MKIARYIFLVPFGIVALIVAWGWFQAFMAFDVSKESFKRDHYKWKLEGMREFKCICQIFNGKQFEGEVVYYDNPLGAGANDQIVIKISEKSDSYFFDSLTAKNYLGYTVYSISDGMLVLNIGPRQGPQNLSSGDKVFKPSDSDTIFFMGDYGKKAFNPYYKFDDEFKGCLEVDTMNVLYNLNQFIKYDSLSRRSKPLDYRTIEYMAKRIEEQNQLKQTEKDKKVEN